MSGRFEGLQSLVRSKNELVCWIPCFGHSLNLVGTEAMKSCSEAKLFFSFLEHIYVYFTSSTNRYNILSDCLKKASSTNNNFLVPKRVSTTRWSSRADATKALVRGYSKIRETLSEMADENSEAQGLYDQMSKLETGIFAIFWNDILERVNATNKSLQTSQIDFNTSIELLSSLESFITLKRDLFHEYEREGAKLLGPEGMDYKSVNRRKRTRNIRLNSLDGESSSEVELTASESFRIKCFLPVIDQFITSLKRRLSAYSEIYSRFGFLRQLNKLTAENIIEHCKTLSVIYNDDLDESLGVELVHFNEFCNKFLEEKKDEMNIELFMLKVLIEKNVKDSFPNVEIMLRIYLCILTTNCSGERAFSKMKIVKDRLRTSMTQENLTDRTILSLEYDLLEELDVSDIIEDFAAKKARRARI